MIIIVNLIIENLFYTKIDWISVIVEIFLQEFRIPSFNVKDYGV